jgi:hypothetical protein
MIDKRPDQPYASALDIPSYRDMYMQLRAVKPLLLFSPKMRRQMKDIENKLRYLARTVDEFYDLFGPRHWVFHGQLNPEDIGPLLKLPVEEAERNLIGLYKDHDWLDLWVRRIGRNPMGPWQTLLDKALEDYRAERYFSSVQLLLSVMDGFVNIVEQGVRVGLHAREPGDMQAWDSVVGHHQGLTNIMPLFRRDVKRLVTEPIYELHRNGIVHGMMVSYGNIVVATKAWNYLFSIVDWADDRAKQKVTDPDPFTWSGLVRSLQKNEAERQALESWEPGPSDSSDSRWAGDELVVAANEYLELWHRQNYGHLVQYLQLSARKRLGKGAPAELRRNYSDHPLSGFEVLSIDRRAPAIAVVHMRLLTSEREEVVEDRWIYEDEEGNPRVSGTGSGSWVRLFDGCPL